MSAEQLQRYRFEKDSQWDTCLFAQADRDPRRAGGTVAPFAPYTRPGKLFKSLGAYAPFVSRAGEILWFDKNRAMHRWSPCNNEQEICAAPAAIACASRVVATSGGLWVINPGPPPVSASLELYEEESFARLLKIDFTGMQLVDVARDGGSILVLARKDKAKDKGGWRLIPVDRAGHVGEAVHLAGISDAQAFVYLQRSKRFVVLSGNCRESEKLPDTEKQKADHPRLHWFSAKGGLPIFSRAVAGMRPCFKAGKLGSDSRDKIFLSGKDGADFGGKQYVLILDGDGNRLEDLPIDPLDSPVTGIAASRDSLFVTGPRGLSRFDPGEVVPVGDGQVRCALITPALFSADREDGRRWLRAEVNANLPEGSTLEILYAATDKPEIRDRFNAIAKDDSIPGSRRVEQLLAEPGVWSGRTVFHGTGSDTEATKSFAAKLFDVTDRYLWVSVALGAGAGGRLPFISRLDVLYPGRSLMENLPAIYRKQEAEPGSFLRGLVGTLEMTTQELDDRIGSMGGQINPSTAKEPWLDFIARWLGVPWDDELSLTQKQAILARAPELAKGRGTRAGLEALLESLIPGTPETPRRFRVTDATADFGFAIVGESGGQSCGSTLPAMLGGNTRWSTELDSNAVLGYMRLGCEGQREDGVWQLAGKVRVEVAATASERKAWEPWLTDLIAQMTSLTAHVEFRWVTAESLRTTDLLDGTLTLGPDPIPHLGTDAITSLARLPRRGTRLSGTGPVVGTRLDR